MINIWEELNKIEDEEWGTTSTADMNMNEMATVRACQVDSTVDDIDFSFYFSHKNSNHGIRIKVFWNRDKFKGDGDGFLELHGNYRYQQSSDPHAKKPKKWEVDGLRYFARKYKVLFAAVWEGKLNEDDVADFFKGRLSFSQLLASFDEVSEGDYYKLNHCHSLRELEQCVRDNNIFNMND